MVALVSSGAVSQCRGLLAAEGPPSAGLCGSDSSLGSPPAGGSVARLQYLELSAGLRETRHILHLNLQEGKIPENILVILVDLQCIEVALDRFVIILSDTQKAVYMPADVTAHNIP